MREANSPASAGLETIDILTVRKGRKQELSRYKLGAEGVKEEDRRQIFLLGLSVHDRRQILSAS